MLGAVVSPRQIVRLYLACVRDDIQTVAYNLMNKHKDAACDNGQAIFVDSRTSRAETGAERRFPSNLGGGCS